MEKQNIQQANALHQLTNIELNKVDPRKFVQNYRSWLEHQKLVAKYRGKDIIDGRKRQVAYQMYVELVTGRLEHKALLNFILTDRYNFHYTNRDRDRRFTSIGRISPR